MSSQKLLIISRLCNVTERRYNVHRYLAAVNLMLTWNEELIETISCSCLRNQFVGVLQLFVVIMTASWNRTIHAENNNNQANKSIIKTVKPQKSRKRDTRGKLPVLLPFVHSRHTQGGLKHLQTHFPVICRECAGLNVSVSKPSLTGKYPNPV